MVGDADPNSALSLRLIAIGMAVVFGGGAWLLAGVVGVRGQAAAGALCLISIVAACSSNLRAVNWRTVLWGMALQLGLGGGDMSVPMMQVTAKEIDLRGSFRFHEEFATAVALMRIGRIDVKPLITHTLPLAQSEQAFRIAADRSQAMKAQIAFA